LHRSQLNRKITPAQLAPDCCSGPYAVSSASVANPENPMSLKCHFAAMVFCTLSAFSYSAWSSDLKIDDRSFGREDAQIVHVKKNNRGILEKEIKTTF